MRIILNETVYDAAKRRIRWLFEEFEDGEMVVNVSGGKDSTVVMHLALEVAEEMGRLPLTLYWLDQEAEWQSTVDIVGEWMRDPRVEPLWLQMPFRIYNATSVTEHWLNAWDPEREADWIHPRDPLALTENVYEEDRFAKLFEAVMAVHFDGVRCCRLSGVRAEESSARLYGIIGADAYGGETWGNKAGRAHGQDHVTMYPIYDWSYRDVWHYIAEKGVAYNRLYDLQHQYGLPIRKMRVSNLHHETAVNALFYVQEFEPDTYARLTKRLSGADMAGRMGLADYFPDELPWMFKDWSEYRDYLLEHLIEDPKWRKSMGRRFNNQQARMDPSVHETMLRMHVKSILVNDWEGILPDNFNSTTRRHLRGEGSSE